MTKIHTEREILQHVLQFLVTDRQIMTPHELLWADISIDQAAFQYKIIKIIQFAQQSRNHQSNCVI